MRGRPNLAESAILPAALLRPGLPYSAPAYSELWLVHDTRCSIPHAKKRRGHEHVAHTENMGRSPSVPVVISVAQELP